MWKTPFVELGLPEDLRGQALSSMVAGRTPVGVSRVVMSIDDQENRAAATYNAAADCYDQAAIPLWDRFGRRTVERLSLKAGQLVLDVCCGSGSSALPAAEQVGAAGHVLGIDLADRLLAQARTKARLRGLTNNEFRLGDLNALEDIPYPFDAVICVFGIFFCADMVTAAARLWNLVRPGGVLAVTTWGPRLFEPANSVFWEAVYREAPEMHKTFHPWDRIAQPAQLFALLEEAGVPRVEVELEPGSHTLQKPDDWWTIVLGSGYRGTVEQLPMESRERLRRGMLARLTRQSASTIETNVLYATAHRAVD
jgi:ubiquinone/menaquinone biosynthesis C-methylase UbiE